MMPSFRKTIGIRATEAHYSNYSKARSSTVSQTVAGLHGERLHQIVVFELREDGTTEYSTMTLRALYNYVVRTITEACKEANQESSRHDNNHHTSSRQRPGHIQNHSVTIGSGGGGFFTRERLQSIGGGYEYNNANNESNISRIGVIEEEPRNNTNNSNSGNGLSSPDDPTTPSSPYPPITTPHASTNIPPHLPSLTSSNATPFSSNSENANTGLPTPNMSNQSTDDHVSPHHTQSEDHHTQHHQQQSTRHQHVQQQYPSYHPQQRESQTAFTPLPKNSHRERLGGYLHPRDMRRLVTPFSSSNEPQLMVRRHVMLLNFDPLRAIVLRDRLLVLVPDGADAILIALEQRVRGGIVEMENQVFGTSVHEPLAAPPQPSTAASKSIRRNKSYEKFTAKLSNHTHEENVADPINRDSTNSNMTEDNTTNTTDHSNHNNDEWEDIQKMMDWKHMSYELQSVDAVLQTVLSMLMDDARKVHQRSSRAMSELRGEHKSSHSSSALGEHAQERLRLHKDEVNLMEGRVQGFVRAMNEVLDDDEDMTLMNLSRLLTHPERFLQPMSKEILDEESDEPELILEAYLQGALSIVNELVLLKGQIMTTEEQISMTLDAIRNRLLFINTLLSVASLCVAIGSLIGSIFGMNLKNHIEEESTAFIRVTVGVIVGMVCMWAILSWIFFRAANIQSDFGKKNR